MDNDFVQAINADPLTTAAEFYAARLSHSAKAVAYLQDELGLSLEEAAEFRIGFSDRRLGKHLPSKDSLAGRELRSTLVSLGLYKASGHEALRGCLTIPLFGDAGKITGIYGRRIDRHGKGPQEITIGEGRCEVEERRHEKKEQALTANDTNHTNHTKEIEVEEITTEAAESTQKTCSSVTVEDASLVSEEGQVVFLRDDRRYRVRGLEKNTNVCTLKVNLMASRDELVHLDTLDLVKARSRKSFIKAVAAELYVDEDLVKKDIGTLLLKLESLREQQIAEAKAPQVKTVELTQRETDEAMELLRHPQLLERIVADVATCGIVGEATNTLTGYLAATSRKLPEPLAIVIQSSSSAGKTSLMDAILAMMPAEDQLRFSGMTGQSLFYLDSSQIRHKTLAISEEEGIAEATYALKLLQSEGELRHAAVGRAESGNMVTQQYHVEGPVQIMLTTTAMEIDEELVNRCLVLTVDESRGQTGEIIAKQRDARSFDRFVSNEVAKQLRCLHQNAQRLLKPIRVFNPYATQLTFPDNKTRLRRDHQKYLTLIDTIALLHQHQRPVHVAAVKGRSIEYINVEAADIAAANGIAGEVLGRSLDELSPQTRRLLWLLHEFVRDSAKASGVDTKAFRFTRRDLREATDWSDTQVHKHLTRLVELEYLVIHRGKHGRRYVYELLYRGEGQEGQPFLLGLIDPSKLKAPGTTRTLGT